ncbi:hypothetical protein DL96DRAFT_192804 [Flagelloscypha sp. PMI_526]|nr:hypothetical protein DL96DRAFT_192804 [Flagelloscypha sp. PMI_526]
MLFCFKLSTHRPFSLSKSLDFGLIVLSLIVSISSPSSSIPPTIIVSPFMRSKVTIFYRTLPFNGQYPAFRLDSRLGKTEECV